MRKYNEKNKNAKKELSSYLRVKKYLDSRKSFFNEGIKEKLNLNINVDELENMDMLEFCRLYSRAEWIVNKMYDGCQVIDIVEAIRNPESINNSQTQQNTEQQQFKEPPPRDEDLEYDLPNTDLDDKPISHMTPEQIQAMDDFYKKYPMFDKSTDYAYTGNVPQEHKLPPALRPNWGRRK